MTPRQTACYGWRPQLPDQRDKVFTVQHAAGVILPPKVDLRENMPPVVNQFSLGSCTANAIAAAMGFNFIKQKLKIGPLSRLFIYYNERAMEGTVNSDSGAQIRDGIKSVNQLGVCEESLWPYNVQDFKNKPDKHAYDLAAQNTAIEYLAVDNTNTTLLKQCLAAGFPFVFGFTVYESFESDTVAKTGVLPLPKKGESVLGGHAVCAVGYDDAKQAFIVRNSWGEQWGISGHFYMPYKYITNKNLASDFWTIRQVK